MNGVFLFRRAELHLTPNTLGIVECFEAFGGEKYILMCVFYNAAFHGLEGNLIQSMAWQKNRWGCICTSWEIFVLSFTEDWKRCPSMLLYIVKLFIKVFFLARFLANCPLLVILIRFWRINYFFRFSASPYTAFPSICFFKIHTFRGFESLHTIPLLYTFHETCCIYRQSL